MTAPLPHDYGTTTGALPHVSRTTTGGNGMEWNGREWKGKTEVTLGLWLLVVETLIFNIISQRARPMMTKIDPPSVNADGVMYRWRQPLALAVA